MVLFETAMKIIEKLKKKKEWTWADLRDSSSMNNNPFSKLMKRFCDEGWVVIKPIERFNKKRDRYYKTRIIVSKLKDDKILARLLKEKNQGVRKWNKRKKSKK